MNSFYRSYVQPLYLKAIVEPFWKLEEWTRPQSHWTIIEDLLLQRGVRSVLDVGCGPNSGLQHIDGRFVTMGVDIFPPYVKMSKSRSPHDSYIVADANNLPVGHASFDAVLLLDLVEHLHKSEAMELIRNCERIARKLCVIFTLNGLVPQASYDDNPWQEHKCGFTVEELARMGYHIRGYNGWRSLRQPDTPPRPRWWPPYVWQIVINVSQRVVVERPRHAFQLLAWKCL